MDTPESCHTGTVKQIIEETLLRKTSEGKEPRVLTCYVVDEVKNTVSLAECFNAAIRSKRSTKDGLKNVHIGATAIVNAALADLSEDYIVDRDNFIRPKEADRVTELAKECTLLIAKSGISKEQALAVVISMLNYHSYLVLGDEQHERVMNGLGELLETVVI